MSLVNKFNIGNIVTFKTHPLLYDRYIQGDGKLVPPFMVIKEVYFEDNKKRVVDTNNGKIIGERIKYTCLFFDDNKCEFKEVMVYESMIIDFKKLYISRMDGEKVDEGPNYESIIDEVSKYKSLNYNYGNIVYFKTKKLEILKKRSSIKNENISQGKAKSKKEKRETIQNVVNYSTPEFVLCGYKEEQGEDLFYPNGKKKKIISKELYKVKWFNSNHMKFSEQFLPKESLIDKQPFPTLVPHNVKNEEN